MNSLDISSQPSERLTILVADDAESDLLILSTILTRVGHRVIEAQDGFQAVELYQKYQPDIVILDVVMPKRDGFETAKIIKEMAGTEFVPIIFLTSLTDTTSLVKGLDAGGDDFLSKPYNRIVLNSKINALNRLRNLQKTVVQQKDVIQKHNERLMHDQMVAKTVFDKIAHIGGLDTENVRYFLSPLAIFNGDIVVASCRPNGNMVVLLGDFTGHGLSAAIGAMPLASTFYAMIPKGFGISDILFELNRKLKSILPVSNFCCAIIVEINFRKKELYYWNGGIPDAVVFSPSTKELRKLESSHLPLGIVDNRHLKTKTEKIKLSSGDRVFLWTDGVHEVTNSQGAMFGEQALWDIFRDYNAEENIFDEILKGVNEFSCEEKTDDISLIEIAIENSLPKTCLPERKAIKLTSTAESFWNSSLHIDYTSLAEVDPLSIMVNGLMEFKNLRNHQAEVFAITSELYTNALEHGVLNLDSKLKSEPDGFRRYYELKQQRLHQLASGGINVSFSVRIKGELGELKISVEDSGEGFDVSRILVNIGKSSRHQGYAGRGLMLVNSLCHTLEFLGSGNRVEATFLWSTVD